MISTGCDRSLTTYRWWTLVASSLEMTICSLSWLFTPKNGKTSASDRSRASTMYFQQVSTKSEKRLVWKTSLMSLMLTEPASAPVVGSTTATTEWCVTCMRCMASSSAWFLLTDTTGLWPTLRSATELPRMTSERPRSSLVMNCTMADGERTATTLPDSGSVTSARRSCCSRKTFMASMSVALDGMVTLGFLSDRSMAVSTGTEPSSSQTRVPILKEPRASQSIFRR
mmetsp:Transcript_16420/g.52337  ORF Transcript_16420/g.52337 Transcript_16420/m.52337 type:complete len:227 (+) Transcript_16420:118-798(+)